jgi:hypothetical protein
MLLKLFLQRIDVFEQVLPRHEFCKRFAPSSAEAARHKHALSGTRVTAVYTLMTFIYNVTIASHRVTTSFFFYRSSKHQLPYRHTRTRKRLRGCCCSTLHTLHTHHLAPSVLTNSPEHFN